MTYPWTTTMREERAAELVEKLHPIAAGAVVRWLKIEADELERTGADEDGRRAPLVGASALRALAEMLEKAEREEVASCTRTSTEPRPVSDETASKALAWTEEVRRKCREIISRQLDVDEKSIRPESLFIDDLGADSLAIVELTLAAEETFDIDIPDEDVEKIRTAQDAYDYLEERSR